MMQFKHCHFIGIGGIGMSALAKILLDKNIPISGSDQSQNYVTKSLQERGAEIYFQHSAQHIQSHMTVVYSTQIDSHNPELEQAKKLNCTLLHRSDLLAALINISKGLSIAGTHGKTSTSALLTFVLYVASQEPSFAVGGMISQLNTNGKHGAGDYFVAEADESDGTFLKYFSEGAIITNIDFDHMDFYQNKSHLFQSFKQFSNQIKNEELFFWCGEDNHLVDLSLKGFSYGFNDHCDLQGSHFNQQGWKITFDASFKGINYPNICLPLCGYHNALNALAVFGLCLQLGISADVIKQAFLEFKGVLRRCEFKGEVQGILVLDDYAHHPTEIKVTLEAVKKAIGERRLIAVYQPHRYSRTQACLGQFGQAFDAVDQLILTEIYAATEQPIAGVNSEAVMQEIIDSSSILCEVVYKENLINQLLATVQPDDVVITLGAGDITYFGPKLLEELKEIKHHCYARS